MMRLHSPLRTWEESKVYILEPLTYRGETDQGIVLLAYYHGLTRDEIAGRLGQPVATVKTWLRRTLAQLKDCLGR